MRPIECVMDSNSNPTLHALELGSAIGFTKETIIPQKPPPHDNAERWRDAAYSIRHTSQCYSSLPNRPTPGLSANSKLSQPGTLLGVRLLVTRGVVRYIEFKLLHAMVYVSLPESLLSSVNLRPPCPLSGCDFPTTCCRHFALRSRGTCLSVGTPLCPSRFLREADLPSSSSR